jgi:hypothetical protein
MASTYRPQGYRGSGQPDEAAIAGVRVMDGVGIFMAELVHNLLDAVKVSHGQGLSDQRLELESTAFAPVVQLVAERLGDINIHGEEEECRHSPALRGTSSVYGLRKPCWWVLMPFARACARAGAGKARRVIVHGCRRIGLDSSAMELPPISTTTSTPRSCSRHIIFP